MEVSAEAFQLLFRRKDSKLLVTSLLELNRELENREPSTQEINDIRSVVPQVYYNFLDVFSKEASDELPPLYAYNYRIELEKASLELGYILL